MNCHYMQIKIVAEGLICCSGISIFYNSPLKRGDKGVCKFAATHPQPLFLEGSLKVAAAGSLIYCLPLSTSFFFVIYPKHPAQDITNFAQRSIFTDSFQDEGHYIVFSP